MSKAASTKDEFEEQIRQEQILKDCAGDEDSIGKARTRVDEDGMVFEWDMDKKAWFPKIDADFIAQYQMNYGAGTETTTTDAANTATAAPSTTSASFPSPSDPNYSEWYNYYYGNSADGQTVDTTTKEYKEWYDYYYSNQEKGEKKEEGKEKERHAEVEEEEEEEEEAHEEGSSGQSKELQEEYWKQYYEYYQSQGLEAPEPKDLTGNRNSGVSKETKAEDKSQEKGKKGEKRKAADPPSWFNVEEDNKNTNVYVHGLPPDTTEDEYKELMNKCGLVMYDPRTRKLKLKLYRKDNGELKGDGLCCYIKPESVELALQILDGSDIRGYKLHVEPAKFEMKGSFDPSKRKKKLSNREKKKFQEKQSKLFDWRPDKVNVGRGRHERVVIIKNVFDPKDFDKDPGQINETRADLRQECAKYGEVKKVQVYDHNAEGVVSVTFSEPEEADVCLEAITGRWFAQRQLVAETWDGNTKYDVVESEKEKEKRLKQWEEYLEGKTEEEKTEIRENEKTDSEEKGEAPLSKEGEGNASKEKPSQDQMDIETDDEEEEEEEEDEDMKEQGSTQEESSTDKEKEDKLSESDAMQGDAEDS